MYFSLKNIIISIVVLLLSYNKIKNQIISIYEYNNYKHVNLLFLTNTIFINGEISRYSINNAITKLNKITKFNNIEIMIDPIVNLVINSNGGDYINGYKFILNMKNIKTKKIKFHCYVVNAYSTAFTIFQYCDKRFVTPTSILFQHNATIGYTGSFQQFEEFYETNFEKYRDIYFEVTKYIASKIGLEYKKYLNKIQKDWLIKGGKNILENKLADEIVILRNLKFL